MIEMSKSDVLEILKAVSLLEGFLFSVPNTSLVMDCLEPSINLLTNVLLKEQTNDKPS